MTALAHGDVYGCVDVQGREALHIMLNYSIPTPFAYFLHQAVCGFCSPCACASPTALLNLSSKITLHFMDIIHVCSNLVFY